MSRAAILAIVVGVLVFAGVALVEPRAAAGGWLIAFVAVGGAAIGGLAWRMIGALTGGAWAEAPALAAVAGATPLVLALALPLFLSLPLLYPWTTAPWSAYLSPAGFIARSVVVLGGLGLIAVFVGRSRSLLTPAVGLVFYGATAGLMATDWLFSLRPAWIASAGGMALAVQQLGTALAATLALGVADERRSRDLAGLLTATLLAAVYLDLMSYIVVWYGDQADKTVFYRLRAMTPWPLAIGMTTVLGRLAPIGLIALHKRFGPGALRAAGVLALFGFWLETGWMIAPETGRLSLLAGAAATLALGALSLIAPRRFRPSTEAAHA